MSHESPQFRPQPRETLQRARHPTRILVVDDEVGLTRLLRRSLEEDDRYAVRVAHSGRAGLEAALEFEPDLVLLDVVMPGMSGREMAGLMGQDARLAATPILFLTALPPAVSAEGVATLDGHPCIEKPLRAALVIEAIENVLRQSKRDSQTH